MLITRTIGLLLAVCVCGALATRADSVTITLSPVSGTPGSTVDVMGTITNNGPDLLNLDGDNLSVSGPLSAIDEFLNNAPFTLAAGASDTFEFFQIVISPTTPLGLYGTDNSDLFTFIGDFPSLAGDIPITDNVYFTVDVVSSVTTPEPGIPILLCCGLLSLVAFHRKRVPVTNQATLS